MGYFQSILSGVLGTFQEFVENTTDKQPIKNLSTYFMFLLKLIKMQVVFFTGLVGFLSMRQIQMWGGLKMRTAWTDRPRPEEVDVEEALFSGNGDQIPVPTALQCTAFGP